MSDVKVSGLPADSSLAMSDYVVSNEASGPTTKRATYATIAALLFEQVNIPTGSGSPVTRMTEQMFDYVASGLVLSGDAYASTRAASMTSGIIYINGRRLSIAAVTARLYTASVDTYVDVLDNADGTGTLVYTEVANNAASPSLAANSVRIGIIVTGAGNIAAVGSVNQGQVGKLLPIVSSQAYESTDSLGNLICPRDPQRKILGRRTMISGGPSGTAWSTSNSDIGLSVPVIVPAGRSIKITFMAESWSTGSTSTGVYTAHKIVEGATALATVSSTPSGTANMPVPIGALGCVLSPSAGLHTYKISYANSTTGPLYTLTVASTSPATVLVELV